MPRVHNPKPRPHIMSLSFPLKPFLGSWVLLVGLDLTLGFQVWEFGPWLWQLSVSGFFLQILCFPEKLWVLESPQHTLRLFRTS